MKPFYERFGLLRRRECVLPTWRGWLLLLLLTLGAGAVLIRGLGPFLSVSDRLPCDILVVEGWEPDEALQVAVAEFRKGGYQKIYVTGGPIEIGSYLVEYKSFAELGRTTLIRLGISPEQVEAAPAPAVRQDRTYASAVALRDYLDRQGLHYASVNLMSVGAHARRSRLMFEKALGAGTKVGILAIWANAEDTLCWWRSSEGFRTVTGEAIAYCYARFLFRPALG